MIIGDRPTTRVETSRTERPRIHGKFLFRGDEKLFIRGVTYGTFRPDDAGEEFHDRARVERDFARMAANGINAVRTYTVPPLWFLDAAEQRGLYVMVGLPWEQHITFLDGSERSKGIEDRIRASVRVCAGHPAVLCYAIGNEIPAQIVRWHGPRKVERFLERLYKAAKSADPESLVTYVNYPSTEYLNLPFLDFVCFNVYLESQESLQRYLARLQNQAGNRPLVMAEMGLDSRRNGEEQQAETLSWQIQTVFGAGCAGAFVFAWTDEWHRGGYEVDDWDFGLTDRARLPKPALETVRDAYAQVPFPHSLDWPRISVVVCSYNGARTIRDTLDGVQKLEYSDFEVIVVDDGSTDETASIASEYDVRLVRTENRGLSAARNAGLVAATGEIIAYIDDDAYPDPHWLQYLAATFMQTDHVGVGGPNLAPAGDGWIAECVANAPGGPIHVLLSDQIAEHIPGCNMAYRTAALDAIGGFDPRFRVAGDDVDICWRLQEQRWTIGFNPSALVWHHRRNSVRTYLRQQRGYGRAETLLEGKWPEKYNAMGHLSWAGRLYGHGLTKALPWKRDRIHYGTWGEEPFQQAFQQPHGLLGSIPLMPEWHILTVGLLALSALGLEWAPLRLAFPLFILCLGISVAQAAISAKHATFSSRPETLKGALQKRLLTALLHLTQPLARISGRRQGACSEVVRGVTKLSLPRQHLITIWSEQWRAREAWLQSVESALRGQRAAVVRGGKFDRHDLEVRGGFLGGGRLRMVNEEHGNGKQLLRFRLWPRISELGLASSLLFAGLAVWAAIDSTWLAFAALGSLSIIVGLRTLRDCGIGIAALLEILQEEEERATLTSHATGASGMYLPPPHSNSANVTTKERSRA